MPIPAPTTVLRMCRRLTGRQIFFDLPPRHTGHVALTFDDGPHPEGTPRILDALAAAQAQATFFFQGSTSTVHPELVRRAHGEGHFVAAHGMTHDSARKQSTEQALRNAADCHAHLEDILGLALPRVYRPPYGELTVGVLQALLRNGFRIAFWNIDSHDSFVSSADDMIERLQRNAHLDRAIILFHDDYAITAEATPSVLTLLRERGLKPTSIGDCAR